MVRIFNEHCMSIIIGVKQKLFAQVHSRELPIEF